MNKKFFHNFIFASLIALLLLPQGFVLAQSSSVQVGQQVNNSTNVGTSSYGSSPNTNSNTNANTNTSLPMPPGSSPAFFDVVVVPGETQATITWRTDQPASMQIVWGTTTDYTAGSLSGPNLNINHSAVLNNLTSDTRYYFKISVTNNAGVTSQYTNFFVTRNSIVNTDVPNVNNFRVVPNNDRIELSWTNPDVTNFDSVRILRSDKFYPLDPFNGEVVYEGPDENEYDLEVTPGKAYYYTVFSVSDTGEYSSGTVGSGLIAWYSEEDDEPEPGVPITDIDFFPSLEIPSTQVSADDFQFTVGDGKVLKPGQLRFYTCEVVRIAVQEAELYRSVSAITATVADNNIATPDDTYLFAYNRGSKAYELSFKGCKDPGTYVFRLIIFDQQRHVLQKINIPFLVLIADKDGPGGLISSTDSDANSNTFKYIIIFLIILLLLLLLLLILLILIIRAIFKKRDKKKKQKSVKS